MGKREKRGEREEHTSVSFCFKKIHKYVCGVKERGERKLE